MFRALVFVMLAHGIATADELRARAGQPIREVAHDVDVDVTSGVAHYRVRRSFANTGPLADEATLVIDVPDRAVATELRIWARGRWFDAELMEREAAADRYRAAPAGSRAAPPVLLEWFDRNHLVLHVFPVEPGTVSTVQYTLSAPADYAHGTYHLAYPRRDERGLPLVDPIVRLGGARIYAFEAIAVPPPLMDRLTARLGVVDGTTLARFEIDAAPQLSPLPVKSQVVFVIDASYSISSRRQDGIAAQLAVIYGYLAHVPDASVELVAVRRRAQRVFGKFVPVSELRAALDDARKRGALALGNGSALDAGARLAVEALADRAGPRRVVILTDGLVRSALSPSGVAAWLARDAPDIVVHVVALAPNETEEPTLDRDDDAPLAPIATRHHGIYAVYRAIGDHSADNLAPALLGLVRPTRIDALATTGIAIATDQLAEGSALRVVSSDAAPANRVVITGKLWDEPIHIDVARSPSFSRATAAFAAATDDFSLLDDATQLRVATAGGAVSPVTSFVAADPQLHAPARENHGSGRGTLGARTAAVPSVTIGSSNVMRKQTIDAATCVALVKPAGRWSVRLRLETTRDEIVDVTNLGAQSPLASCLVETAWALRLPPAFAARDHSTLTVSLP